MSKKEADRIIGRVRRVNGPVVEAEGITDAGMLEMVEVGKSGLSERLPSSRAPGALSRSTRIPPAYVRERISTVQVCP